MEPRNAIVSTSGNGTPTPYGWDWSATTHGDHERPDLSPVVLDELVNALEARTVLPGKGLHGWTDSLQVFDAEGYKRANVYYGGRGDLHVVSTSGQAHAAREAVLAVGDARTSRVDTQFNLLTPFEELREVAESLGGRGTKVVYYEGSTLSGGGGKETSGRTVYIGSPTSQVRVRIYEKWLESPGKYRQGTNRVEVQFRPPSRAKYRVSDWTPAETFCASRLTRRLADALGADVVDPGTVQLQRAEPDLERSLSYLGRQYGKTFEAWCKVSGGDVTTVIEYLASRGRPKAHRPLELPDIPDGLF